MSIRCGACKARHSSVSEVRACHADDAAWQVEWAEERRAEGMALAYAENAPLRNDQDYEMGE